MPKYKYYCCYRDEHIAYLFSEQRKLYNTAVASTPNQSELPQSPPDAANDDNAQPGNVVSMADRRPEAENAEIEQRLAQQRIEDERNEVRNNIFNGPIPQKVPFFGQESGILSKIAGTVFLLPIAAEAARRIGNLGINGVKGAYQKVGKPVWSRAFGTPESRADGAYGAIGDPFIYNIVKNVQRAYGATMLGTHGGKNSAVGLASGVAATGISLPGAVAFGTRIATKPLSWLGKTPLLNKIPGYSSILNTPDNIMKAIHKKIFGAAGNVYGWSADNWKGVGKDIGGIMTNAKGAIGSTLEAGRIPLALLSTDLDMKTGGALTNARKSFANSKLLGQWFKKDSLTDDMTFEA